MVVEQRNQVVLDANAEQGINLNENEDNLEHVDERKRLSEIEKKLDKISATFDIVFKRLDKITSAIEKRLYF